MMIKKSLLRILFIITIPIFILNIVCGTIMLLPYWIVTGKVFYDSKMITGFNKWHTELLF